MLHSVLRNRLYMQNMTQLIITLICNSHSETINKKQNSVSELALWSWLFGSGPLVMALWSLPNCSWPFGPDPGHGPLVLAQWYGQIPEGIHVFDIERFTFDPTIEFQKTKTSVPPNRKSMASPSLAPHPPSTKHDPPRVWGVMEIARI